MLSFNIEGFHRNKHYLKNLIRQVDVNILFLQELWLPYHDKKLMEKYLPNFCFNIATPDMFQHNEDKLMNSGPVWHGCAVGWHKDLSSNITLLDSHHERIVGIKYVLNNHSLLLISVYAPPSGRSEPEGLEHRLPNLSS